MERITIPNNNAVTRMSAELHLNRLNQQIRDKKEEQKVETNHIENLKQANTTRDLDKGNNIDVMV